MSRHRTACLVILSLLVATPLTAEADGAITGLEVSPSGPVTPGTTVAIRIKGAAVCEEVLLDFGDGNQQTYSSASGSLGTLVQYAFPIETSHLYCTPGTFHIQAKPKKGCVGEGSVSLTVQGQGCFDALFDALQKATMKAPALAPGAALAFVKPSITGLTDGSNITPSGSVGIKGHGFGNEQGTKQVFLGDLRKYNSPTPNQRELKVFPNGWTDTQIVATIPSNIAEVMDQTASLYIRDGDQWSSPYPVKFKATKDMRLLPASDVQVLRCSDYGDDSWCNGVQFVKPLGLCSFGPVVLGGCGGTMSGYHWTCVGSSFGTDSFVASLKNGWSIDHTDVTRAAGATVSATPIGPGGLDVKVQWNNQGLSASDYCVSVSIVGPKGVPHK